jgi:hypothetical protein
LTDWFTHQWCGVAIGTDQVSKRPTFEHIFAELVRQVGVVVCQTPAKLDKNKSRRLTTSEVDSKKADMTEDGVDGSDTGSTDGWSTILPDFQNQRDVPRDFPATSPVE